jgi:putative ABC transport system permease protein
MSTLRQIGAVTAMNLKSIPQRFGSSLVVVVGIAGVVGVLVSVLAMSNGLMNTLLSAGSPERAIVLRSGANNEGASFLASDAVRTIMDAPGVAHTSGEAEASAETFVPVNLLRKEDGSRVGVVVRGVSAQGLAIRPEIKLLAGRLFKPGLRELIAGRSAQAEFRDLEIGDEVVLRDGPWKVVGTFEAGGAAQESGLLTDADTLLSAYQRTAYNSVHVRLASLDSFDEFRDALTTNPTLSVTVLREPDFYKQASQSLRPLLFLITDVVGGIMALGALFAALNTLYSAVSTRVVEIATLRAIGFGAAGVVASVLGEALLLALLGAVIGAAAAALFFDGNTISLGGNGGTLVTEMKVTPALVATGALWACAVGLIGGLFPAIRAARLPVATALRSL